MVESCWRTPSTAHGSWFLLLLVLAAAAFLFYMQVLNRLDTIALNHREELSEELCKT